RGQRAERRRAARRGPRPASAGARRDALGTPRPAMKHRAMHRFRPLVAASALLVGPGSVLPGQEAPAKLSEAVLQARLAELDREIETERALAESLAASRAAERRRILEERAEIAGRVVRLGLEAERSSRELAELEPEVAALAAASEQVRILVEGLRD